MFQILYPLGFLAAIGIAVPIIIHLWNVKSGKTLKIGSVFLLGTPSNQRSRSFKVQDWPLLLIRSLLVLLTAFLLANPVYYKTLNTDAKAGWVLLEKESFSKAWRLQHKQLDSLLKAGYELHDFAVNFEKIDLKDTNTVFSQPATAKLPYYSLIRQLDAQLPAGTSAYIFANSQQQYFEGEKPQTRFKLHWNFLPVDTSQLNWVAAAYTLQNGAVKKLGGHSTEKGIYYQVSKTAEVDDGLNVDTTTINVQIHAGKNTVDAKYIAAVVQSIKQFTQRRISVQNINAAGQVNQNTKLLFWLSDKPLRQQEMEKLPKGMRLFSYAGQKPVKFRSELQDVQGIAMQDVVLYQKAQDIKAIGKTIWQDGSGAPILSLNNESGLKHYRFYSRFSPEWNSLVWSDQMVFFLMPLILPEPAVAEGFRDAAKLQVDTAELNIETSNRLSTSTEREVVEQELSPWIWTILILLLFVERWITYTKRKVAL